MGRVDQSLPKETPGKSRPDDRLEKSLQEAGYPLVAGVDEAGRGPLAGPVVAACVILPQGWENPFLDDSKRMNAARRAEVCRAVEEQSVAWGLGVVAAAEIDQINIHRASLAAMCRAVEALETKPDYLVVDGRFTTSLDIPQQAVVKGDRLVNCIAAASVVAKVHRDAIMESLDRRYPQYKFASNKGYPTAAHKQALAQHGPCPFHRMSYRPVAQLAFSFAGEEEGAAG